MAGLLDFAKSPAGQGLLAAGFAGLAGANRNTPINNIGRAGLAGLTGYSAASAIDEQRSKREEAERIKSSIPGLYSQGPDGQMKFDIRAGLELGIPPEQLKQYAEAPQFGAAKVARTQTVDDGQGGKRVIQLDDYGNEVGAGYGGYVAPQLVDTGDRKQFVTPQAGQAFDVNMSPSQADASSRGWAGVNLRGESNDIARETNSVMRELGLQEKRLKVDELEAKQSDRQRERLAGQASIAAQIGVIDKALSHPGLNTAVGMSGTLDPRNYVPGTDARNFQVVVDQLGGAAFLQAFESLKGGGQITEVEGKKATDAMARLNRAQSDDEFRVALEELRGIMAQGQARLEGTAPGQGQKTISRTGTDANGRKVIQYSDGSMEYGD